MTTFIKCKVKRTELVERKFGTYCLVVIEVPGSHYKAVKLGKAFLTQDDMIEFGKAYGMTESEFLGLNEEDTERLKNRQIGGAEKVEENQ